MRRVQIRKVADLGTGHTPSRSVPEYWIPEECTIPWLTLADVKQVRDGKTVVTETNEKISVAGVANSSAVVHPVGTVAFSRTASVGFSCILGTDMATSQDWVTWTCSPELDPRYLLWALRGERDQILGRTQGSTHKTIYMPDIEELTVPLPSVEEQRQIAKFLDAETDRIDQLISTKTGMIDLSREREIRALADLACGRVSGAEVVDTGIDWLGSIPTDWTVERLKFLARMESGHTPARSNPDLWVNADKPWITLNDVTQLRNHEFIADTVNQISDEGLAASSARMLPPGTVVLSRDATIGRVGIMAVSMATSQHFINWVCSPRLDPRYLWLVMRVPMQQHFHSLTDGATLRTIGMPDINNLRVPVPPVYQQHRIVAEAEEIRRLGEELRSALTAQIALLQERRRSLIIGAVSGERKVA